jgi:hypothetical protein
VRREVLDDAHVDGAIERTTASSADFQDLSPTSSPCTSVPPAATG